MFGVLFSLIGAAFRLCFWLPLKLYIVAASAAELLALTGVDFFEAVKDKLGSARVEEALGFVGGTAPISSWTNFKLTMLALLLAVVVILPVYAVGTVQEVRADHPLKKLEARLASGERLSLLSDFAGVALVVISFMLLRDHLATPFEEPLRLAVLMAFGVGLGIDNLSSSADGQKLGMAPFVGRQKAVEVLAKETGLGEEELSGRSAEELLALIAEIYSPATTVKGSPDARRTRSRP